MKFDQKIKDKLKKFEQQSGYVFEDLTLLRKAVTHSSYANEHRAYQLPCNERLEFLGDAVLNIIVSDHIFRTYPTLPEGELTRIRASVVCEGSLARCARQLKMGDFLLLGKGEALTGGRDRDSILSDAFEAVLGAIYSDSGLLKAQTWLLNKLMPTIHAAVKGTVFRDYKTLLQEHVQKTSDEKIIYHIDKEIGPDHNKKFYIKIILGQKVIGNGSGRSKKEAEQKAAYEALKQFGVFDRGDER